MSSSSPIQIPVAGREETSDQRHHHGSIDDSTMLAAYQDAVLQSASPTTSIGVR